MEQEVRHLVSKLLNSDAGVLAVLRGICGIQISDQPAYVLTNSLTIEGWIRPRGDGYNIFFRGDHRGGLDPYFLGMSSASNISLWITDESGNNARVGTPITYNVWTYVAATLDGTAGALKIYTNGVLAAQTVTSIRPFGALQPDQSPGIGIGNVNDGGNNFPFIGDIDEISLYNRALTAAEIQSIYNAGSAGKTLPTAATNSCVPPPSELVSWWPGEGTANDVIGTNTGTLSASGAMFASAEVGHGFRFDGTNGYVQIPDSPSLKPANVTVEAWVWLDPSVSPGTEVVVFKKNSWSYLFEGYNLAKEHVNNGNGTFSDHFSLVIANNGNQVVTRSTTVVQRGVWYHVAGTYDGNKATIWVNGVAEASNIAGFPLDYGTRPVFIGQTGEAAPYDNFLAGIIDEPSIYSRALTTNEIQVIYNAGSAGKCQSSFPISGLVLWNTLGSDTEVSNSVYGPNLQKYVGGTWPDVAANTSYGPGEFGNAVGIGPGGYSSESRVHNLVLTNLAQCINPNRGTIDVWFKQNSTPTPYVNGAIRIFDGAYGLNSGMGFNSLPPPDNLAFGLTFGGTSTVVNYDIAASNGTWLNLAGIWDIAGIGGSADKLRLYVNGQLVASTTNAAWGTTVGSQADIAGGEDSNCAGQFLVDDLKVFNRALTASEVVQVYGGGGFISGPPAIYNFSPASATNGAVVAIVGTNFSATAASNIVYFGAVQANVLAASPTSLTVTVPVGATYAPITVTANGYVAYAQAPFMPTFAGNGTAISSSTFATSFNLPTTNGPYRVVIADLDGDGRPDLVVDEYYAGTVSIYQSLGTTGLLSASSFAAPIVFSVASNSAPFGLTVADVNGDGKLDLLICDGNNNQIAVFQNLSAGGLLTTSSFAAPVYFAVGAEPSAAKVCDMDGDGHPDIVSVNNLGETVSILRNKGAGGVITMNSFAPRVDLATAGNGQGLAVGDLDGDSKPEMVVGDNSGVVSIFQNQCTPGNISFAARVDLPAQSGIADVAISDLDGDGKPELISTAYLPQNMSVFRNLSSPGILTTNSFAASVVYALAGRGHSIAVADINGDGKPDIAEVTELNSALSLFQNIGTSSFTNTSLAARVDFATSWNAWGVAVGDLDGDGRPDVVFANQYDGTITIYQNQTPFVVLSACTTAPAGLVGWWPGEGNANDVIGTNNGTLSSSGVTFAGAEVGHGFRFDGTNGYVQIPDSPALKPANVTVEAWVWLDPNVSTLGLEYILAWTPFIRPLVMRQFPVVSVCCFAATQGSGGRRA